MTDLACGSALKQGILFNATHVSDAAAPGFEVLLEDFCRDSCTDGVLGPEDGDNDVDDSKSDEESDPDELDSSEESLSDSELESSLSLDVDNLEGEDGSTRLFVWARLAERVASGALKRALPSFALARFLAGLPVSIQRSA